MADPAIAVAEPEHRRPGRTMFMTIGTIASFKDLITEILSEEFLTTLEKLNFKRLIMQCGPDLALFEKIRPQKGFDSHWIDILGFDYTDDITPYYLKCAPSDGKDGSEKRGMGIIMAHAGSGTILDALNVNSKLIVIPNTSLMDNHQLEFAVELDKQGYLLRGHLGKLDEAVKRMEDWQPANWPPQPPRDALNIGDYINALCPIGDRPDPNDEESLMWFDMYKEPFTEEDGRLDFLNGEMSAEKTAKLVAWRDNWCAKRATEKAEKAKSD
ncbi:hypothetical protein BJ170DRAFT_610891 [Xylariales sp. AK1849]|nr:hypothetical protein BJ170DRAFT_610891 [Xylariales sp. AK1849]